jgi:hypothetical protein
MLFAMSRYPLHTVTSTLLVVVELGPKDSLKDAVGRAVFLSGERGDSWVRAVRAEDVKERLRTIFTPKDISLYVGAVQLKQALDAGDEWALQSASEKVRPWMADFAEFPSLLLEIDTVAKQASLKRTGVARRYSGFVNYSRLVADMFGRARLVMLFSEKDSRLLPALYCPDWKTAAFVVTFMGRVRVCADARCNAPFIPLTDKQRYCIPAHGGAYRTARSRRMAKQRAEEKQKQQSKKQRTARKSLR